MFFFCTSWFEGNSALQDVRKYAQIFYVGEFRQIRTVIDSLVPQIDVFSEGKCFTLDAQDWLLRLFINISVNFFLELFRWRGVFTYPALIAIFFVKSICWPFFGSGLCIRTFFRESRHILSKSRYWLTLKNATFFCNQLLWVLRFNLRTRFDLLEYHSVLRWFHSFYFKARYPWDHPLAVICIWGHLGSEIFLISSAVLIQSHEDVFRISWFVFLSKKATFLYLIVLILFGVICEIDNSSNLRVFRYSKLSIQLKSVFFKQPWSQKNLFFARTVHSRIKRWIVRPFDSWVYLAHSSKNPGCGFLHSLRVGETNTSSWLDSLK